MTHRRTTIRNQITALLTGLATTGPRVHQSRMAPVDADDMPCLLVTTGDEDIAAASGLNGPLDRSLSINVRGYAMGATVDAVLDQISEEVEIAMTPAGFVLRRIEIDFDESLERPVGSINLSFETLYFTPAGNPGVSA
jgi:hypothetical protein